MDIDFFNSYCTCMAKNGYRAADKLKDTKIPDVLYKYFPCAENRLNSLSNQKLWLAQHETFNDPHEFEFMYIDEDYFTKSRFGIDFKAAKTVLEANKRLVSISCFTTNPYNDYFWNNYAENKKGFCVEYKINRKANFYPVVYTNDKIEISDMLINLIWQLKCDNEAENNSGKKYSVISEDGMNYISFLYFNFCCKRIEWKIEDEYRLVFANTEVQNTPGKAVSYNDLYIKPNEIFIGECCSSENNQKLEKIAENLGINVHNRT